MGEGKLFEVDFAERRGRTELIEKMAQHLADEGTVPGNTPDEWAHVSLLDYYRRELNESEQEQARILAEGLTSRYGN